MLDAIVASFYAAVATTDKLQVISAVPRSSRSVYMLYKLLKLEALSSSDSSK